MRPSDLTPEARIGYMGNPNPYIQTSPNWYAHSFGAYMHSSGRPSPRDVRMGRGDSIRCNDMRFAFKTRKCLNADSPRIVTLRLEFERIE